MSKIKYAAGNLDKVKELTCAQKWRVLFDELATTNSIYTKSINEHDERIERLENQFGANSVVDNAYKNNIAARIEKLEENFKMMLDGMTKAFKDDGNNFHMQIDAQDKIIQQLKQRLENLEVKQLADKIAPDIAQQLDAKFKEAFSFLSEEAKPEQKPESKQKCIHKYNILRGDIISNNCCWCGEEKKKSKECDHDWRCARSVEYGFHFICSKCKCISAKKVGEECEHQIDKNTRLLMCIKCFKEFKVKEWHDYLNRIRGMGMERGICDKLKSLSPESKFKVGQVWECRNDKYQAIITNTDIVLNGVENSIGGRIISMQNNGVLFSKFSLKIERFGWYKHGGYLFDEHLVSDYDLIKLLS